MDGVKVPAMVRATLADPAEGLRQVLALGLGRQARWLIFAVVAIITVLPTEALLVAVPADQLTAWERAMRRPFVAVLAQAVTMIVVAGAITQVGRWFGGRAQMADAILAVAWVQFIMFLFQIVQFALLALLPPLGVLFSLVSLGVFLWLLVGMTGALNGFTNRFLVLLGVIGTALVIAFVVGVLATAAGFAPEFAANV